MPLSVPRPLPPETVAGYRAAGWWPNLTLTDLLRRRAAESPHFPAIIAPGRLLTFADLERESDRLASGLARLGVGHGDVVSGQLSNVPEILVLHHAVAKRRAIFNPIHLSYRTAEVETILGFAGTRVLIVGPPHRGFDYVAMARGLRDRLPSLGAVVALGGVAGEGAIAFDELRRDDRAPAAEPPRPHDPFLLLFTSGTTASPKATLHTHDMRLGNARFIADEFNLTPADRILSLARYSHMWGITTYWMALWAGIPHVLLESFSPAAFVEAVEQGGATIAIGAPPHIVDLLAAPGLGLDGLASLRLFALSGSACPPALVHQLRRRARCTPLMFWGMTETGGGCFTRPGDDDEVIAHTIGRAAPGCTLAILDEAGRPRPGDDEGELAIKSPFVFEGYVNNPEATAESFTPDGWFRTGDVATIDAAGRVRILGRRKEQINRGGVKFHPADVEEVLLRHPGILMVALVGMPDARLGERNCCFAMPRPGVPPPTLEALTAWLAEAGVAKFKWPERLEVLDALPLTPTGKVQRAVLRDRLAAREGVGGGRT